MAFTTGTTTHNPQLHFYMKGIVLKQLIYCKFILWNGVLYYVAGMLKRELSVLILEVNLTVVCSILLSVRTSYTVDVLPRGKSYFTHNCFQFNFRWTRIYTARFFGSILRTYYQEKGTDLTTSNQAVKSKIKSLSCD